MFIGLWRFAPSRGQSYLNKLEKNPAADNRYDNVANGNQGVNFTGCHFTMPIFQPTKTNTARMVITTPIKLAASMFTSCDSVKKSAHHNKPDSPENRVELCRFSDDRASKKSDSRSLKGCYPVFHGLPSVWHVSAPLSLAFLGCPCNMRVMLGTAPMLCLIKRDRSRKYSPSASVSPLRWALYARLSVSSVRAVMLADHWAMRCSVCSGVCEYLSFSLIERLLGFFCSMLLSLMEIGN